MPNRSFSNNTSCSEHPGKSGTITPIDVTLAGHVIKVYGDFAIFDTTTGNYIPPEQVTTRINGTVRRGLQQ